MGAPANNPAGNRDAALIQKGADTHPQQWDVAMTAAWVRDQVTLSPYDKWRVNRGRFTGANLVGSSIIQRLTEDDVHKATGVIPYLSTAELKAVYDKADITGNAPEFEEAVVDGETLYDLFVTQSFEAVVGDYFNSDELRPLAEKLWANLTLINDASRTRDARRIFAILDLLLADLRERQEKGDADGEQKEDATSGDVVHVHVDTLVRDAHYP